ncbi:MAG: hypothetical protein LBS50_00050 [Prevotellaceae bacterium]|jgi:hypothetical protein|nr:hypothetical protein [Prevotellaceae bacterium]
MKKFLILAIMMVFIAGTTSAKKPKQENIRYDIECAGNGSQGTYLVKVWVYTKSSKLTSEVLKKYAVHGVIFKGYAGKTNCAQQKPLAQSPVLESERADFFNAFFNIDKAYSKYATEVQGSTERIKVGKEYKYGAVVSVSKDLLRKDLEAAGIIRGLSGGF